jgi:hypothetical protein
MRSWIWVYGDVEGDDVPIRDRPYESFGRQGFAMPTYIPPPYMPDAPTLPHEWWSRGAERIDLGEDLDAARRPARGPKGWQRSDDRIHDEICERLTDDGLVDATEIDVVVQDGEVILTGEVVDPSQRERAALIAEDVLGVVDVVDRIRVVRSVERP